MFDFCQHFSLHQLINEPTHHTESFSSIIDLLFSSNINSIVLSGVGEPILDQNIRYHCPVYCVLSFDVCVYSNSRNDVLRVAQRYGTIAAHTRRRASLLVMFVVFCVHMHSFTGLIRRTPPPTFSDTAITDRHSDTTIFQLRAHWVRISWSIGSEKSFGHVPPVGVEPSTPCMQGEHPIH